MPKTTTPTADIAAIEEHPLCKPLHSEKAALLERQREMQATMDKANAILRRPESENSLAWRKAKKQALAAKEALDDIQIELFDVTERLEAAMSTARHSLRPQVIQDVLPALEQVERAMLTLLAAQETLLEADNCARKLGIALSLSIFADTGLPARLAVLQRKMAALQN